MVLLTHVKIFSDFFEGKTLHVVRATPKTNYNTAEGKTTPADAHRESRGCEFAI